MKIAPATLLVTAFLVTSSSAQEVIPQSDLSPIVPRLLERASDQEDLALKTDGDATKAFGMKAANYGVIIIPNKGFTADALQKAGKETLPVGQLWMARLAPAIEGKPAAADKLRMVRVTLKDEEHRLPLLLLGVRMADDKPELLVYAKGKEPLLRLPLTKTDFKQELPLEIDMRKLSEELGLIDINIAGRFNAGLQVGLLGQ